MVDCTFQMVVVKIPLSKWEIPKYDGDKYMVLVPGDIVVLDDAPYSFYCELGVRLADAINEKMPCVYVSGYACANKQVLLGLLESNSTNVTVLYTPYDLYTLRAHFGIRLKYLLDFDEDVGRLYLHKIS